MPKKKGYKKNQNHDFTLNDCANAVNPVTKLKKSSEAILPDLSWDQVQDEEYDIVEKVNEDGTKNFVYKKKNKHTQNIDNSIDGPGVVYPEIVWYLVSKFIKPEDVGRFAGINKTTYAMTKRPSFWRLLYHKYCENHQKLPERLCLEKSFEIYGLRQRVIRALYHTYDVFINKVTKEAAQDSKPHDLVKHHCVNVWFRKSEIYWSIFFKFKKVSHLQRFETNGVAGFIEELGRVDANPEENSQVLQVTCKDFYEVPPLMGLTLSSVSVVLSQGFRYHRLHLGFNTGYHNVSKDILPECSVVIDTVVSMVVFDWWHPNYPHFDNKLPSRLNDDESLPVLKRDFFSMPVDV